MNRNNMIQTLRRFKVTSGYKGYYYLLMLQISLADSIQKKSRLRHRMIYISR